MIHPHDIQYSEQGEPFVAYQFLKPASQGLLPDKPYCNLWIKKDIAGYAKSKDVTLTLDPKRVMKIKDKPVIYKGLLETSIQYKLDHKWFSELYCKNVTKLDSTKDIFGIVFTEMRMRQILKPQTSPEASKQSRVKRRPSQKG